MGNGCRITRYDTLVSACSKMSEGNPGALNVLMRLIDEGGAIDPDAFMGGMSNVFDLDTNKIYGSSIWILYKDICGEDLRKMIAVLRSVQLGFLCNSALLSAIEGNGKINVDSFVKQVEDRLPNFSRG